MFRKLRKYFFFLIFLMLGNFCLLSGQSIYYSKSSQATNLENISAWSDTQNELGVSPIDFSNPDDIYVIDDPNATIGADWDVSGVIFVGDGSVSASFSVPQSFGITSYIIIDVLGPSTVNWASSSIPQIGFLDDNSWVHYNRNGNQNILAGFNYPNLRISGSGIKTYSVNLTVDFHLLIESGAQLAIPAVSSRSLTLNGSISGTGTLRGGNTFAASIGSLNIIGSGNLGTLYFTPTAQVIRNFNLNRTGTTVFLGNDLSLQLNASIAGGVLDIQNNRLTVNSLLGISSSNFQSGANGTVAYSNTLAGVTQTIAGLSYGNLTYSNSNKFFTNRLISVAGLFSPGTANGHSSTGSTFLFSGVDGQSIPGFNFVNLSFLNGNKNFSNSVISISGVFAPNNIFQNTITGSTFLYVGANVPLQTVAGFAYNNLTIRNNKQLSPSNTISIAGIYVITAAGTITTTNSTVEFNGATNQTIPATFYHNLLSTNLGGRALPNTGSITIRGNFVPGTNIYTITGSTIAFGGATGQTIPGFNYFNLSCPGGGLNRVLGTNTTIGIAGTFTTGTTNYSSLGSTVNYNGSIAQAVRAIPYFNLIASNTNTKTVASGTVVNGNVSVVGAAQMAFNTGSYQFNGDIFTNNSGNFNLANGNRVLSLSGVNSRIIINSTVNPSFAGNTSITGSYTINSASIPINFARLQLRNSVPSTICLSLSGLNTQISTSLNLTSGRIATGNAAIVITTGGIVTGGSVASYIQGNLIRRFSASPNNVQSFPIGTAMAYAPARLTVPGLATAGNLRMSTNDGDAPNISTAGFSIRINRNWSTSNFGITPTTCIGWLGYDVNDYTGDFSLFNRLAVSSTTGWRLSTLSGISATMATISGARNIISLSGICQIGRIGSVPGITNWIGAVNTDWFNVGNWSNGLPSTSIDAVINTVVGINYPLITTTGAVSKNITITGNANLSLAGINGLYLNGNFINNGSFYPQNGIINISGTGVSISGVSVTTFYNLSVVGNTNLVLGQGINIQNTFYLGSSTASITTNGFPFVILSNASGTGRIGVVPMGAAINGNITVQRYLKPTFAPTSRLFYHLATPVNGTTVGEWQNSFYISGFFSFPSVNTATGITAGSSASLHIYNPLTALFTAYPTSTSADPISVGTGYRAFIRDGSAALSPNTSAKTITVTGTPIIGNHAFTGLNYTVVGTSGGWNFIGNPYAAEIYGDLTDVSKWPIRTNINPAVYTWNPEGRCYNSFISGVATSCAPSTSTFTGVISSSQGFWVQASAAAPNLTVSENAKTTSGGNFYRQGRMEELLYVRLNSNLYSNEIAVRFEDLSSKLYDNEFDAYKLETGSGQGGASPLLISSLINNKTQALSIDTRPNLSVSQSDTVYFNIVSPNGSDTIRFLGKESFNPSMQILLLDDYLNTITDISSIDYYTFDVTSVSGSKGNNRFRLIFNSLPQTLSVSADSIFFSNSIGEAAVVSITSNMAWEVNSEETWFTSQVSTTTGNAVITITTNDEQAQIFKRISIITFTGVNGTVKTLKLIQNGATPNLSLTDSAIMIVDSISTLANIGVVSNAAWEVINNADWLSVTPNGEENGILSVLANEPNPSTTNIRTTKIIVTLTGTVLYDSLYVSQIPSKAIFIPITTVPSTIIGVNTTPSPVVTSPGISPEPEKIPGDSIVTEPGINFIYNQIGINNEFVISPNPTEGDFVTLKFNRQISNSPKILVHHISGILISSSFETVSDILLKINLPKLNKGVYLLSVDGMVKRFVVE